MANEFVARRGIIAQTGGAKITGSLLLSGSLDATGYAIIAKEFTGSFSGSINTAVTANTASYVAWNNVDNKPAGIVSSSTASSPSQGTVRVSINNNNTDVDTGLQTGDSPTFAGLTVVGTPALGGIPSSSAQIKPLLPDGTVTSSAASSPSQGTVRVTINGVNTDVDTGLQTGDSPSFAGLTVVGTPALGGIPSSSAQIKNLLPTNTISSSAQFRTLTDPFTGSFTGSFTGDGSGLTGIASTLLFSGSTSGNDTLNLKTEALIFSGSNGLSATVTNNTVTFGLPLGTVSASSQVLYTGLSNIPSGIVSTSAQIVPLLPANTVSSSAQVDITATTGYSTFSSSLSTVDATQQSQLNSLSGVTGSYAITSSNTFTGVQTINNNTNSTLFSNGALVVAGGAGFGRDVNVSGSLTVLGLLTAVSQSVQYVTSSQLIVGDNKIIVNVTDLQRFGGLTVNDSGSTSPTSASIFWDSLEHRFIYENLSGSAYNSAIFIAGPKNTGTLGNEAAILDNRVPVGFAGDHIDNRAASSSIRVDFPSRFTHIEAGLYITGGVSSSLGFTGSFTGDGSGLTGIASTLLFSGSTSGNDTLNIKTEPLIFSGSNGITATVTNNTVTFGAPLGTVSSSGQVAALLPPSTVSSSTASSPSQGTVRVTVNGVNTDVDTGLQTGDSPSFAGLTVVGTPALGGIPSSSAQVKVLLPVGTVTSSAQYPGWVTASSQIQLASITGTTFAASNFTFPQQLTVSGILSASTSAYINNTLYSGSTVTGIVGPVSNQVIAMIPTASYDGAFFDYVVKDGTNSRLGTVMSIWSGASLEFTDTSTQDIGNTADEVFTVDVSGPNARLKLSTAAGTWAVKTTIRAL